MEIIHALRGLGLGSPRTGKGLELDGGRGEVIRPMDKSRKPPRAPTGGHKRARKSNSLGADSPDLNFSTKSSSASRAASPSPSVKSNRSSISLRLFGRQRSASPSPSVASVAASAASDSGCSTRLSRPPRLLASKQPDLPTNSEIGFGFAERVGATREAAGLSRRSGARGDARSVASLSSAASSSVYYYGAPPAPPRFPSSVSASAAAASRNSIDLSISEWSPTSTSFPVREFRPELYLDPNQGQSVGWLDRLTKCIGGSDFCPVTFACPSFCNVSAFEYLRQRRTQSTNRLQTHFSLPFGSMDF